MSNLVIVTVESRGIASAVAKQSKAMGGGVNDCKHGAVAWLLPDEASYVTGPFIVLAGGK
ncbi:MAG: hypothetical protein ACI8SJ_000549 [Shewanella sp.]|jgi:hypothetical protein